MCFPSLGFLWGPCLSFLIILILFEGASAGAFFSLVNPWVLADSLSFLMEVLVVVVLILSLSCSVKDLKVGSDKGGVGIDGVFMLTSLFSFFFFFFSSWMGLYFFFEASLIPTLWLILKWGYQPERLSAGLSMLLYTSGASLPMLLFIIWMGRSYYSDEVLLCKLSMALDESVHCWIWVFTILGFLVKFPMYGFHGWLPKAHVEAPLGGSMILAGVLLKLGCFGLVRMMWCLNMFMSDVMSMIISLGLWGGVMSGFISMLNVDLKGMIAYSSVGHMSFVLGGLLCCLPLGKVGGQYMMFAHGVVSPCLFALAASSYDWSQSRSVTLNKGILQIGPLFSVFWFVFVMANLGCPPSVNFYSEVLMITAVKEASLWLLIPMSLMTYMNVISAIFLFSYPNHGGVSSSLKAKNSLSDRYLCGFLFSAVLVYMSFLNLDYFV
uniref:NADH-ubiquinone oxidoreductase chain 4 n=1 Tax=Raeta pulchella TaxID=2109557 RepID=A0AA49X751_9BIVA|nr:NADH dehydrogenase subunit 4 [Raeta pulchella]WLK25946.1 NADH dehydrogenase subunit 4 [Raeta pulchella]